MTADLSWQPTLGADTSTGWRDLADIRRRPLTRGAWVDLLPTWLGDADELFQTLVADVPWRAERRQMYDREVAVPRLTAWYPIEQVPHEAIRQAARRLDEHYGVVERDPFASAGLCLYRDGDDSVAWHGDRIGRGAEVDTMVAILSLGNTRRLLLRPRGGGSAISVTLGHGDLLVMGGTCQRTWDHCVPKSRSVSGPRVSIQFRPTGVA